VLYHHFLTNKDKPIHKWVHYFPVYERHLSKFKDQSVVFWEIGVFKGGSLGLWQSLLGPMAVIVGLDINPACRQHENEQCRVRIGSQSDTAFLSSVIDEFGPPDVVLDDGSHKMDDIRATFDYVYPRMNNNGVYMIEDLHTCYWPRYAGGGYSPDSFIDYCKTLLDQLNGYHVKDRDLVTDFTKNTSSMCFYDSMAIFEKMRRGRPYALHRPPKNSKASGTTEKQLAEAKNQYEAERRRRLRIKNSLSWKLTAPVRAIGRALGLPKKK
jgi:hypothetical protein